MGLHKTGQAGTDSDITVYLKLKDGAPIEAGTTKDPDRRVDMTHVVMGGGFQLVKFVQYLGNKNAQGVGLMGRFLSYFPLDTEKTLSAAAAEIERVKAFADNTGEAQLEVGQLWSS
jgi:hypothetical protein